MADLLGNITIIITFVIGFLAQITVTLLQNPIFAILMAVIFFLYLVFLLIRLINYRTGFADRIYWDIQRKKTMERELEEMPYYKID